MNPLTTICILTYGDYPELAERCLGSVASIAEPFDLVVGMNAVSEETYRVVHQLAPGARKLDSPFNLHKYPMMRRMFATVGSQYIMWFDDDTFVRQPRRWLPRVERAMRNADMIGRLSHVHFRGQQFQWMHRQPWYQGRAMDSDGRFPFIEGGWWCIRTSILRRFDWPFADLDHRGGDTTLGMLAFQHQLRLADFQLGLSINAAQRRGFDGKRLGFDG